MLKLLVATVLALGGHATAVADELLFAGRVEQLTLHPYLSEQCPERCPRGVVAPAPNGMQSVCIPLRGHCQTVTVKVETVYVGSSSEATQTFKSITGEFNQLQFPASHELILVHADKGVSSWSRLSNRDGKLYLKPPYLHKVGGVLLRSLAKDANNEIALDDLLERVSAAQ